MSDRDNVLFLTYEGLRADAQAGIEAIGQFLGGAAAATAADPDMLETIVRETSIERMRCAQQRWSSRRPADAPALVRKGAVGDWRSEFSPAQARRLAVRFDERTRGTAAGLLWPDTLDAARSC